MKKHVFVTIIIGLLLLVLPLMANADTVASGTCGDNLTWTLDIMMKKEKNMLDVSVIQTIKG